MNAPQPDEPNEDKRMRMWLVRAAPRKVGGPPVHEYLQLHAAGIVPPGVALYRTRSLAEQASKYASDHPCRPTPAALAPAATTT